MGGELSVHLLRVRCRAFADPVHLPYALTVLFWVCSLLILIFRCTSAAFRALVCYGGRVHFVGAETPRAGGVRRRALDRVVSAVSRSWMGTVRVRRRDSFVGFYVVGCASAVLLTAANVRYGCVDAVVAQAPLWCFGLHCLWRLGETLWVFHFDEKGRDSVSLFAAVSGAVFYVFAALSCNAVPVGRGSSMAGALSSVLDGKARRMLTAEVSMLLLLYIYAQVAQARVHASLAGLRAGRRSRGDGTAEEETPLMKVVVAKLREAYGSAPSASAPILCEKKLLSYHFPFHTDSPFAKVLEPHYFYEVLLYLVNAVLVGCVSWACWTASSCRDGWEPRSDRSGGGSDAVCSELLLGGLLRVTCAVGVLVFSAVNLSVTAAEHRAFWQRVNKERRKALHVLRAYELHHRGASKGLGEAEGEGEGEGERESALRACVAALREERLPEWNLLYGIF